MEPVNVVSVSYYGPQLAKRHYTDNYDLLKVNPNTAIFRRGYNFYVAIGLERDYNAERDIIRVVLKTGSKPKRDITYLTLPLKPKQGLSQDPNQWSIALDRVDPKYVVVEIHIPANAPIGEWSSFIRTNIRGSPKNYRDYNVPDNFYIIFNPWIKQDGVYLESEVERNEYILNDTGKIWLGTWRNPRGRHWIFGHFEAVALRTALLLLDRSRLTPEQRGNPVLVARAISAIVNSDDDNGLLVASWNGNYSSGTPPYAWTGSTAILEQYYNSDGIPVKYGLCWVFSAVTVTICRALGIPCRSTTVYVAAQGTNNITRNYDAFGNLILEDESNENESLWNYHVWNEVWLARPNIDKQFSGWQVIDATPQRHSDGIMQCGPASVAAVRQGFIDYAFDTDFVYAKLNADVRHFIINDDTDLGEYLLPRNNYQSGKRIVTKSLGSTDDKWDTDLLDVTSSYKSTLETSQIPNRFKRSTLTDQPEPITEVSRRSARSIQETAQSADDVSFDLVEIDTVPFGETFNVVVEVQNNSHFPRNIWSVLAASSVLYTGKARTPIDRKDENITLKPGEKIVLSHAIPASKYRPFLVDQGYIKLYAFGEVKETGQRWAEEDDFLFNNPVLTINAGRFYKVGESVDLEFSFTNPLNVKLTDCYYTVEGPADSAPKGLGYRDVQPLEEVKIPASFNVGNRIGFRRIVVAFTSKQLPQVYGSVVVKIEPNRSL